MTPAEFETFLFDQIPQTKSLGVLIRKVSLDSVELTAPLEPNRNHLGTAFGGSLGTLLVLAGYTWLYNALAERGHHCNVVLRKSNVDYLKPVDRDFVAVAHAPTEKDFAEFFEAFERKGKGRIVIKAEIKNAGNIACLFTGEFIART